MKIAMVCSPYAGDVEFNVVKARAYCRILCFDGFVPLAPHLIFTQFLDDQYEDERQKGIDCGIELMKRADVLVVFGNYITAGMQQEILAAHKMGLPIEAQGHGTEKAIEEVLKRAGA